MIYKVITEESKRFKNQNRRHLPRRNQEEDQYAFASGNAFESLAKTNPEYIERDKLKSLLNSKNLVDDFNKYFTDLHQRLVNDYNDEINSGKIRTIDDAMKFNTTLIHTYYNDFNTLINETDASKNRLYTDDEVNKMLTSQYIPESLTEEGCRALIKLRLDRSRILTDTLINMLKLNYKQFNLSAAEASNLISELDTDSTNHIGMAKIKSFLEDPKLLNKFRLGSTNYDFRSIGGGCLFLSATPNIQISQNPSKNLANIFKYDAIVVGHGIEDDISVSTAKAIHSDIDDTLDKILDAADSVLNYIKSYGKNNNSSYIPTLNNLKNIVKKYDGNKNSEALLKDLHDCFIRLRKPTGLINFTYDHQLKSFQDKITKVITLVNRAVNHLKAKQDPKQAIKDGKSQNWTQEPISTLSASDLTSIVDILRALKREGFKNVFIGSCNPGGIRLPKDLENDKDFKVTYGTASTYLEMNLSDYSLDELHIELNDIYNHIDNIVLTEGKISDFLNHFIQKAIKFIEELWRRVIEFFKQAILKIKTGFAERLGSKNDIKLKKPIEMGLISFNGKTAKFDKVLCNSVEDVKKNVYKCNESISQAINQYKNRETEAIRHLEGLINSGKLKKSKDDVKRESCGIFKYIKFV